ncbi:MAG TPA: hypothetical protein VJI46_03225 [Candidatus Nanoarchaeia archaeon]|nr:hypothetical protein [Candidatus Nanoarchaeia archaeon]
MNIKSFTEVWIKIQKKLLKKVPPDKHTLVTEGMNRVEIIERRCKR